MLYSYGKLKLTQCQMNQATTGCPKVHANFEIAGIGLICYRIPKPFDVVNPHTRWFYFMYDNACQVNNDPTE